jgi:hypothetical protein
MPGPLLRPIIMTSLAIDDGETVIAWLVCRA